MDRQIITFRADNQVLVKLTGKDLFASNIVSYIDAQFDLGTNWSGFDAVRAVWQSNTKTIATVLDEEGKCSVPAEMMRYPSRVAVNLVGSVAEGVVLKERLTTYPVLAFTIDKSAKIYSDETPENTATLFEQFAGILDVEAVVNEWITEHPEYVTTVVDGSLTDEKFSASLKQKYMRNFDTVAEMKTATGLVAGMVCHTNGFYSANDGGEAFYYITDSGIPNNMDVLACGTLFAVLIVNDTLNVEALGAKGFDDTFDNKTILNYAVNYPKCSRINFKGGLFMTSAPIVVSESDRTIDFGGATLKGFKNLLRGALIDIESVNQSVPSNYDFVGDEDFVHDVTIQNAVFEDNDFKGDTNSFGCDTGAWNITYRNIKAVNSHRKAFAPQSYYANAVFENIVCINCRSGFEIGTGRNVVVKNVSAITDGSTNTITTEDPSPIFGLNIASSYDVTIDNVYIEGYSIALATSTSISRNVKIKNSIFNGGVISITNSDTNLENCEFKNCSTLSLYAFLENTRHQFNSCKFNVTKIVVRSDNIGAFIFDNCVIELTDTTSDLIDLHDSLLMINNCVINAATSEYSLFRLRNTTNPFILNVINSIINNCYDCVTVSSSVEKNKVKLLNNVIECRNSYLALYGVEDTLIATSIENDISADKYYHIYNEYLLSLYADVFNNELMTNLESQ